MSILDTFFTVFKADSDSLQRGYREARKSTDEIVEGMRKAEQQAERSTEAIGNFIKGAAGWLTAALSARKVFGDAVNYASDVSQLQQISDVIGVAISDLDAFRRTIEDSGGNASRSLGELQRLYRRVGAAAADSESQQAKMFQSIGVAVRDANGKVRDSLDIMMDMGEALRGLDRAKAMDLARKLGIADPATLELMLQGRKEFEVLLRRQKEQGVITKEGAERVARFDDALTRVSASMRRGKDAIVDALLPALTWVTEVFASLVEWFNENKAFVVGFFTAVAAAVAAFFLPAMIKAAAATLAATWPFLLIGAAIGVAAAAIALIVDDIVAFMNGNDSLIGQISEQYPAIGRLVERVGEVFKSVWGAIVSLIEWVGEQFGVQIGGIWDVIKLFIRLLLESINSFLLFAESVSGVFENLFESVKSIFGAMWEFIKGVTKRIAGVVDSVFGALKGVGKWLGLVDGDTEVTVERTIHDEVEEADATGRKKERAEEAQSAQDGGTRQTDDESAAAKGAERSEKTSESTVNETTTNVDKSTTSETTTNIDESTTNEATTNEATANIDESTTNVNESATKTNVDKSTTSTNETTLVDQAQHNVNYDNRTMENVDELVEYHNQTVMQQVEMANAQVEHAAENPMNAMTTNSIRNAVSNVNEQYLNIGEIRIETQATNAEGIAKDVKSELERELAKLNAETASGVVR